MKTMRFNQPGRTASRKLLAVVSAAAVFSVGATGLYAYAQSADTAVAAATQAAPSTASASSSGGAAAAGKEETVYVLAGADGSARKIIVSTWLKNPTGAQQLIDGAELRDVKNVKGDETYRMDTDAMRVWDAKGRDIYYQGTTDKALPVDVSIRYALDGKTVSPTELAGKSGRVAMRFEYRNQQKATAVIGGKETEVYVPFVMLTGMILDNARFTNVQVSNGKLINDGNRTVVMGFALPGMQESLGVSKDTLDIPESVEITADVRDFSLTTTVTLASNELLNTLDMSKADDLDTLKDAVNQLDAASKKLLDGSSELYQGLDTLLAKSGELIAGVDKLAAGAKQLAGGASELQGGVSALQAGIGELNDGLSRLGGNSAALNDGARTVFETLLATADSQLAAAGLPIPKLTIDNYAAVLDGVVSSLGADAVHQQALAAAREQVTAAVNAQRGVIEQQVTAAVRGKVLAAVVKPMTPEQYADAVAAGQITPAMQAQVAAAVAAQMDTDAVKAQIAAAVQEQVDAAIRQNLDSAAVKEQIAAAEKQAAAGRGSVQTLRGQLDSYRAFYDGLTAYTAGVDQAGAGGKTLADGAKQLAGGADKLKTGADDLSKGLGSLQTGGGQLTDGVKQLRDGSVQLRDGLKEFREKGISKLTEAVNGDLSELTERLRAVVELSKRYTSYAGTAEGADSRVRFLYRTDAIG